MDKAFGTFEIRSIDTLDAGPHDTRVREAMVARGLTTLIRSDGCSYPIVGRLDKKRKIKRYEVLDPYFGYTETCVAVTSQTGLHDGWNIHIEREYTICDFCRGHGCSAEQRQVSCSFCDGSGRVKTTGRNTPSCA